MKVIVPYAGELNPVVRQVLSYYGVPVDYRNMSWNPYNYQYLLREIWKKREPVVIVEHDILPWPGAIEELWQCSCAWGAYTYQLHGGLGIYHGFGCTKLTPQLMQAVPDVWEGDLMNWDVLDQHLFFAARAAGFEPHHHRPPVIHLSDKHAARRDLHGTRNILPVGAAGTPSGAAHEGACGRPVGG